MQPCAVAGIVQTAIANDVSSLLSMSLYVSFLLSSPVPLVLVLLPSPSVSTGLCQYLASLDAAATPQ